MVVRIGRGLGLGVVGACLSVVMACSGDDGAQGGGPGSSVAPPTGGGAGAASNDMGNTMPPPATGGAGAMAPPSMAGSGAMPPVTNPNGMAGAMAIDMPGDHPGDPALDECGLDTGYPGDEYCILAPPPDKGFQLRIGPSNYDNPEPMYVLEPGVERTDDFSGVSGNTEMKYFYYRQFRMRDGAHHNIITARGGGGIDLGHRIGTTNHLVEDAPKGGIIAPENEGVGVEIGPNSPINVSLHSINTTEQPLIRELWVNFWYVDSEKVTQPVLQMFQTGSVSFAVMPGQDTILGPYSCNLNGDGRMLWMYGHRHANNRRFSAWRVRGGQRDLIYEGANWEEPMVLEYSTTVQNPAPDLASGVDGGWSGPLDFKTGDVLEWECHVVNETTGTLRFTNNTYTGEMCIVDAELVGVNCGGGSPFGG